MSESIMHKEILMIRESLKLTYSELLLKILKITIPIKIANILIHIIILFLVFIKSSPYKD